MGRSISRANPSARIIRRRTNRALSRRQGAFAMPEKTEWSQTFRRTVTRCRNVTTPND
jgi:hypothetical protein